MGINSNIDKIVANWGKRERSIRPCMAKATAEATKVFHAESKLQMRKGIYDKPVPSKAEVQAERKANREAAGGTFTPRKTFNKRTGGVKAWTRTGNLRRSEHKRVVSAFVGEVWNDAATKKGEYSYARARHDMGKPGHRKTRFPAHWREEAAKITRPKIATIYRNAMIAAMRTGAAPDIRGLL